MTSAYETFAAGVASGEALVDLIEHLRADVAADTAVVLLLDATGTVLEPIASSGLDRAQRAWARIPVGRGFAGQIAASRMPVVIDEVTEANVINPVLRQRGVKSLAGVPLLAEGRLIGVLHVGSLRTHRFGAADITVLEAVASDVVMTLSTRVIGEEHTAALVLQRSLLPTVPAILPGLDIAARYIPAEGDLGGDWYDVFALPGNRVGVVMGDVVGHGLYAAVIMGRLKSALRAYALDYDDPAEVLSHLDHKISHFEAGTYATVVYGVSSAPFDRFHFSSAGHWPPIVAVAGHAAAEASIQPDLMLGVDYAAPRTTTTVPLSADGILCLYTDGLIEHPASSGASTGSRLRIREVQAALSADIGAEANCVRIISTVIADEANADDVALLVIRRGGDGAGPALSTLSPPSG